MTPIPADLARPLIDSLVNEVVVHDHAIDKVVPHRPIGCREAIELALRRRGGEFHRWTDARYGRTRRIRSRPIPSGPAPPCSATARSCGPSATPEALYREVCALGGDRGWLVGDWLWTIRGWMDRVAGGVGMRRGRRHPTDLRVGDVVDFWRVEALEAPRLLRLRAEMRLPGDAWLEWSIEPGRTESGATLVQRAVFRPRALRSRDWYAVAPFHRFIFGPLARRIVSRAEAAARRSVVRHAQRPGGRCDEGTTSARSTTASSLLRSPDATMPAMAEVVRRHRGPVLAFVRRLVGDSGRVEEIAEEVFLRLWERSTTFDATRGTLRAFLLAITHGRALDVVRSDTARRGREERDAVRTPVAEHSVESNVVAVGCRSRSGRVVCACPIPNGGPSSSRTTRATATGPSRGMLGEPEGTTKTRIRSGLARLRCRAGRRRPARRLSARAENDELSRALRATRAPRGNLGVHRIRQRGERGINASRCESVSRTGIAEPMHVLRNQVELVDE